jgi:hypothetical protein
MPLLPPKDGLDVALLRNCRNAIALDLHFIPTNGNVSVETYRESIYSDPMSIEDTILAQIDAEIARLLEARKILQKAGRVVLPAALTAKTKKKVHKKHVLSPEARKRIAEAQRKRWAATRAKAK